MRESEEQLRALMIAGLAGDTRAHHELLAALARVLRIFFQRRRRDAHADVEDLVQDTLIAIHTRRSTYDPARPLTAWVYAVARYKLIDHLRRHRVDIALDGLDEFLADDGFEAATASRMDVDRLLGTLPAKQATAIRDTRLDGLSVAESAARRGLSQSDIKISVHRGLKALAARLRRGR